MMEWSDVRIFRAVAREGSYAKAAKRLGVSLATVGRRMQALEEALQLRLVERLPDGHRLTAAGTELLPAADRMAAAADAFQRTASAKDSVMVRVTGLEWEAAFVGRHRAALGALLPRTEIEIESVHWAIARLEKRDTDIALSDHIHETGDLVVRKLGRMAYAAYGERGYVGRHPEALSEERWTACPWAGFNAEHQYFPAARWLAEKRGGLPRLRCGNAFVVLESVRAGVGLGLLPCWLADGDPLLMRVSPIIDGFAHDTYALINADRRDEAPLRAAIDALARLFRRERAALEGVSNSLAAAD